ncbi:phage tail protein [Providencia sp. PROV260]|uniref:phage tail protein n=1 Tax=Providencia sp. PROV260 TaxID=2949948 RepID=UPI00234A45E4|nr:phage tail protein [Providencia sp. PROV260]
MKYFALLTKLGENLLAQATALGTKLELTHMAVGDGGGSLPTPDTNQTKLIAEKRRAAINTLFIDDKNKNQIIAEQIIPEQDGGWWIREIGLFDKAGNLIAIANCPETYKPQLEEGSGRTQAIRMVLIVSHTESVSLKIDPSVVLATRKYVDDGLSNKQDKGNYADGFKYTVIGNQCSIKPNGEYGLIIGGNGLAGVWSNTVNNWLWNFSAKGTLVSGSVPFERLVDLPKDNNGFVRTGNATALITSDVAQNTGTSKTKIMSQDAVTKLTAGKQDAGNYADGLKYTAISSQCSIKPSDNYGFIVFDKGVAGMWSNEIDNWLWNFSAKGTLVSGSVPFERLTGVTKDSNGFVRTGTASAVVTTDIVQASGSSTTKVMSQDAVTKLAAGKQPTGDYADGTKYTAISSQCSIKPNDVYGLLVQSAGVTGVWSNETNNWVWSFSSRGTLTAGAVPFERLTGVTADANGFVRTGSVTALIRDDVVQVAGSETLKVMSQKAVTDAIASHGLGYGQKVTDVTSARTVGTVYTNSTSKPIMVNIIHQGAGSNISGNFSVFVDDVIVARSTKGDITNTMSFIVPTGSKYRVEDTQNTGIEYWTELR